MGILALTLMNVLLLLFEIHSTTVMVMQDVSTQMVHSSVDVMSVTRVMVLHV